MRLLVIRTSAMGDVALTTPVLKGIREQYPETEIILLTRPAFKIDLSKGPWIIPSPVDLDKALNINGITEGINIGVAPYAKHDLKDWPEENMIILLRKVSEKFNARYWLFGGKEESEKFFSFQTRIPGSVVLSGNLHFD